MWSTPRAVYTHTHARAQTHTHCQPVSVNLIKTAACHHNFLHNGSEPDKSFIIRIKGFILNLIKKCKDTRAPSLSFTDVPLLLSIHSASLKILVFSMPTSVTGVTG